MITQAFVLGAGLGTRLRPLTEDFPKPLIPIFQKPLITFPLDHLISLGVQSFIINTHHRPERFGDVFDPTAEHRQPPGSNAVSPLRYRDREITFRHEPILLGTGGGIKNVEDLLDSDHFIVYSGDLLTDFALEPLIDEHFRQGNDVTLALRKTGFATGIALRNGKVIDIERKYGHPGQYDFANVSVWSRKIFRRIPAGQSLSFIPIVTEWIGQGGKIGGVVVDDGEWFNIGSRVEYLDVHRFIQQEGWKPDYLGTAKWPILVAADAVIDPSVRLSGFWSVGSHCRVEAAVTLENTILWSGAQIASRSRLTECIIRSDRKVEGEHHGCDI